MQINIENYLSKFTVRESSQLFDLEYPDLRNSLLKGICYMCGCKLKTSQKGDVFCNSARHKRVTRERFFIRKSALEKLLTTNYNKHDHTHCFNQKEPPCGLKGKHRCCLCNEPVPKEQESVREWRSISGLEGVYEVSNLGVPNPLNKRMVNHIDSNKTNNNVSNLEWVTARENCEHSVRAGTSARGTRIFKAKLNDEKVADIRKRLSQGEKGRDLAREYKVHPTAISQVKLRKAWKLPSPKVF